MFENQIKDLDYNLCVPVSIFGHIGPWWLSGGLWAIEVSQDVFQVVLISSLVDNLFD